MRVVRSGHRYAAAGEAPCEEGAVPLAALGFAPAVRWAFFETVAADTLAASVQLPD